MAASREILFGITLDKSYNSTNVIDKLEGLQDKDFGEHYNQELLQSYIDEQKSNGNAGLSFNWYPDNPPGLWMANNVSVDNKVIAGPLTLEKVQEELESEKFGYVVLSVYLSGFSEFREIAQFIRREHPEVEIIAGSVGGLLEEAKGLADHVIKGNQIDDLRRIIGQPENDPLHPVVTPSYTETSFNSITKKRKYGLLHSAWGCMYGCDFCPSTAQFGNKFVSPFSAEEIVQTIISGHDAISPGEDNFMLSIAEPQGMGNIRLWREVIRLSRDLPFQVQLVSTTSSKIIRQYPLDELTMGAMSLSTVNIGVESLLQGYRKNDGVDLNLLNNHLQGAGINVVSTYIIGLDWQTKTNIREEMKLVKELGSSGYIIANAEMQPGTPLYKRYEHEGRLHKVPPELLAFYGYQAFEHPAFKPGFDDMLPLLGEVENHLTQGSDIMKGSLDVFMKRTNPRGEVVRENIAKILEQFKLSVNPKDYKDEDDMQMAIDNFAAGLYFNLALKQMDLFHPFINSTN